MNNNRKKLHKRKRKYTVYKDEFEVEDILDKKIDRGQEFYKVKWLGYPMAESTWEPAMNLVNLPEVLKRFNNRQVLLDLFLPKSFTPHANIPSPKNEIGNLIDDIPDQILSVSKVNGKFIYKVQWKMREDGVKVEDSEVESEDLREKYSDLLIDFYESR